MVKSGGSKTRGSKTEEPAQLPRACPIPSQQSLSREANLPTIFHSMLQTYAYRF